MLPNPARHRLTVIADTAAAFDRVTLYDLQGKPVLQVKNITTDRAVVEIGTLPPGCYFVVIEKNGRVLQRKKTVVLY